MKLWKTKPICSLRTAARVGIDRWETSSPSRVYRPEVGWSRQPRMLMSVVLPDPDAPIRATISPGSIASETPLSTGTPSLPSS